MIKETSPDQQEQRKKIPRAVMLLGAITASFALNAPTVVVVAEVVTQQIVWTDDEVRIDLIDQSHKDTNTMVVALGGLGQKSGRDIARAMDPTLSNIGLVAYAEYPDSGFEDNEATMRLLADKIEEAMVQNNKTELAFYAHSMGATILLHLLPFLDKETVTLIFLDCSPFDKYDSKELSAAEWALRVKDLPHGLLSKLGVEFYNSYFKNPNDNYNFIEKGTEAIRVAMSGSSPELWMDEVDLFISTDAHDYIKYWPKNADVVYVAPEDSSSDQTVYVEQSKDKWDNAIPADVKMLRVPNGGHANPSDRPTEYNDIISAYLNGTLEDKSVIAIEPTDQNEQTTDEPGSVALESLKN